MQEDINNSNKTSIKKVLLGAGGVALAPLPLTVVTQAVHDFRNPSLGGDKHRTLSIFKSDLKSKQAYLKTLADNNELEGWAKRQLLDKITGLNQDIKAVSTFGNRLGSVINGVPQGINLGFRNIIVAPVAGVYGAKELVKELVKKIRR